MQGKTKPLFITRAYNFKRNYIHSNIVMAVLVHTSSSQININQCRSSRREVKNMTDNHDQGTDMIDK